MRIKNYKKMAARMLALVLAAGMLPVSHVGTAQAAVKPVLSKKKVSIEAGKSKKISIKNAKKAKIKKTKWKLSKKKIVSIKKAGKYAVNVKAKKKGKVTLTCQAKQGNKWKKLKCTIVVSAKKKKNEPSNSDDGAADSTVSSQPVVLSAAPTGTPAGTTAAVPTGTPADTTANTTAAAPTETPANTNAVVPTNPANPTNTDASAPSKKPADTDTAAPSLDPNFTPVAYKSAGFESDTDGFVGRGGSEVLSSEAGGHTGNCLKVTGRTQNWHGASINVSSTIVKGALYKCVAWVRQDSGGQAEIKLSADLDRTYPEVKTVSCPSGEWTLLEGFFEVPKSFQSLAFYFEGPGGTYDIYVDDVVITQMSEAPPAFDPATLASLKEVYKDTFQHFGTCLSYNTSWNNGYQLQNPEIMDFAKYQFNSFTLENELKPSMVFKSGTIPVAEAKQRGYVIPSSYKESEVPELNFQTVDTILEIANRYGLKMRGHALLWHQQTNSAFFTQNYSGGFFGGTPTTPDVMDARNEFYVKTVMKHVIEKEKELTSKPGSIVYCWDVANEYVHRTNQPTNPSWMDIYGDMGLRPTYVKAAFQHAYSVLKEYGLENTVTLFYNDYDEYDCPDDIVNLVNYINEGETAKICGGIGMQSHITTVKPTLEAYEAALDKFMATGLEVNVTELDMEIAAGDDKDIQAQRYGELLKLLVKKQKNRNTAVSPKGITGVTIWGLLDADSWKSQTKPILFGSGIDDPKPAFYTVIEAAKG